MDHCDNAFVFCTVGTDLDAATGLVSQGCMTKGFSACSHTVAAQGSVCGA